MTDTTFGTAPEQSAGTPSAPASNPANTQSFPHATGSTQSTDGKPAASNIASKVKDRLAVAADTQKGGVADRLDELAESLGRSSEQFAGKQDWIASAIARGGTELANLASSLRDADLRDLARQVQGFAQRRPGVFIGLALVSGFALARFGKVLAADVSRADLPVLPEVGHASH